MKYIDVVIDNKSEQTDSFYTYSAPDEVGKGAKVMVQFGQRRKLVDAYCVGSDVTPKYDISRIKSIESYDADRSLSPEMIDTALWMRRRYGVKYIDAVKMFTVPGKRELKKTDELSETCVDPCFELSEEQQKAVDEIDRSIAEKEFRPFLIRGVTNSGKTEVYMRAVEAVLKQGRTAIILLPEIALAERVKQRFINRFGEREVAGLHSRLSTSRKLHEWLRIKRGEAHIVIGARTSVFAPLDNIGIIVIDEEHESTYKSDHNPKYETVDIAYKRAAAHNAVLVLGSATPSVVSYNRAENSIYRLIELKQRIGESIMPELELIDMRAEARCGNISVISRRLAEEITACLERREQIILFLNRRGFSTRVLCPDCGYVMKCPDCGITLTYHKTVNAAVCHYCGRKFPVHSVCPDCGSRFIRYVGAGTEKVEESVAALWPEASVARFDLDTAADNDKTSDIIDSFIEGRTDILIGTQILAKGLDFRNVGLVGIINADVSLNIPDYRSAERTFQLITQVAGRAGRASGESRVIIQTYDPESDVIKDAAAGDYEEFYRGELLTRNIMNYPPYSDIISVALVEKDRSGRKQTEKDVSDEWDETGDEDSSAMKYALAFRDFLNSMKDRPDNAVLLRPREEQRRLDGRKRVVFMIKSPSGYRNGYIRAYMEFRDRMIKNNADCYIEIDVNPYGIA